MSQWTRRWWTVMAFPVVVCAALALIDIRFAFVALILLCLVLPFVVFNVHFSMLLSPEMRQRLFRQYLIVTYGVQIAIHYEADPEISDDKEAVPSPPPDEVMEWSQIDRIVSRGDYWMILLKRSSGHKPPFIIIPRSAIAADIAYPQFYE